MTDQPIRIAFSTISCPDYSLRQIADAAQGYGYDGVELYALEGERLTPDILAARLEEVKRELGNIPIASINSWGKLSSLNSDERSKQEAQIARTMELANSLACPLVKTFGGEFPDGQAKDDVFDYMAESLHRLAAKAQQEGVTVVIETHDGFCLGADLARLLSRVEYPHIGALWDIHHPFRKGEAPEQTDALLGARIAHAHVKDAVRLDDGWQFVLLGEGQLPVRTMISFLLDRNFQGYVAVDWEKMWHPEIPGPEEVLPQYLNALRTYIDLAMSASPT